MDQALSRQVLCIAACFPGDEHLFPAKPVEEMHSPRHKAPTVAELEKRQLSNIGETRETTRLSMGGDAQSWAVTHLGKSQEQTVSDF